MPYGLVVVSSPSHAKLGQSMLSHHLEVVTPISPASTFWAYWSNNLPRAVVTELVEIELKPAIFVT